MRFSGKVRPRSTRSQSGPPGEADVLKTNPQRRDKILEVTGWADLWPGSLNLEVDNAVVDELLQHSAAIEEPAESVQYPPAFSRIPALRKKYYYFRAAASVADKRKEVLVRRAECPPYCGLVELYSAVSLRDYFGLTDGDIVAVEIDDQARLGVLSKTSS